MSSPKKEAISGKNRSFPAHAEWQPRERRENVGGKDSPLNHGMFHASARAPRKDEKFRSGRSSRGQDMDYDGAMSLASSSSSRVLRQNEVPRRYPGAEHIGGRIDEETGTLVYSTGQRQREPPTASSFVPVTSAHAVDLDMEEENRVLREQLRAFQDDGQRRGVVSESQQQQLSTETRQIVSNPNHGDSVEMQHQSKDGSKKSTCWENLKHNVNSWPSWLKLSVPLGILVVLLVVILAIVLASRGGESTPTSSSKEAPGTILPVPEPTFFPTTSPPSTVIPTALEPTSASTSGPSDQSTPSLTPSPTSSAIPGEPFWAKFGNDVYGTDGNGLRREISLSGDGLTLAVLDGIENDRSVGILHYNEDGVVFLRQNLIVETFEPSTVSLSRDGLYLALGHSQHDGNAEDAGQVRVFERATTTENQWNHMGSAIVGANAGDAFGFSVAAGENIVAVGAIQTQASQIGSGNGYAQVYAFDADSWTEDSQKFTSEDDSYFGWQVSFSGDSTMLAICGANAEVEVFRLENGEWNQVGQTIDHAVELESPNQSGNIAIQLSMDGTTLALGAWWHHDFGQARVFELNGNAWKQVGQTLDGKEKDDYFGWSVALSTDATYLAVSARDANEKAGYVQVYEKSPEGGQWLAFGQQIEGDTSGDQLGSNVHLSSDGTMLAVSAPGHDGGGEGLGLVRLYQLQ